MMTKYRLIVALCTAIFFFGWPSEARAACVNPAGTAGAVVYNSDVKVFQYCNDTSWIRMTKPGSGAGGCANPALAEGKLVYNADSRTLQGCAGNVHRAAGPVGGKNRWLLLDAGGDHSCAIQNDGMLYCWGYDATGQVGDGGSAGVGNNIFSVPSPSRVNNGGVWQKVSAGESHTCAIKSDDTLWCWGFNFNGQVGDNSTTMRFSPVQENSASTWKQVSAGDAFTCAIKTDDTLWCWGSNIWGRTGQNTTAGNTLAPTQINGGGSWKFIAAGHLTTCAIKSDDTLWCWGNNNSGQVGDNTSGTSRLVPTAVSGGGTWKSVSAGSAVTCGIKSDDTLWCWGGNGNGRTGLNLTAGMTLTPTQVNGGGSWKSVKAGSTFACAFKADDTLWCWGGNEKGQLGDNSTTDRLVPTAISGTWKAISPGGDYTCGISADNTIRCWGNNSYGSLGNNTAAYSYVPLAISGGDIWNQASLGSYHSCGLKSGGTLWCWGYDYNGAFGNNTSGVYQMVPTAVSGGATWKSFSSGKQHVCAVKSDDTLWCWGDNGYGQTGLNTTSGSTLIPTQVNGGGTWKVVSGGSFHTCAIKSDDTVWCWGSNAGGRTGLNTSAGDTLVPTQINGGGTWKSVSAGEMHSCGIKSDDTLWCWGSNANGATGQNTSAGDTLVPTQINGGGTWKAISAGFRSSCGIKSDNTAWCWGYNADGNAGTGSSGTDLTVPTAVNGGATWKIIDTRGSADYWAPHTCGIKSDDSLWCWGAGYSGQMGAGLSITDSNIPVAISGAGEWLNVSTHDAHTCGILKTGEMRCWGQNYNGELTATEYSIPYSLTAMQINCGSPSGKPGSIVYNSDFSVMQYCDGAGWVEIRQ